jgi:4-amino-4-deoxy-L-arabinose transferase-like glycosyltransferase
LAADVPRANEREGRTPRSEALRAVASTALVAVSWALLAWAVLVAVTEGFVLSAGPLRVSSHRVLPPALASALAYAGAHLLAGPQVEEVGRRLRSTLFAIAPAAVAILAVCVVAVGTARTSRVAGGSDCFGYVSQAELWMRGNLIQTDPLAYSLANRVSPHVFAPLGYREGLRRGSIVPLYPPGLPLLMAGGGLALGRDALFLVVPTCGGLLVALTYAIGRCVGDRLTGLLSAGLLVASPSFVLQLVQPMSDVPASAAWAGALALGLWGTGAGSALGSGLVASVALLVRPSLTLLAGAVALLLLLRPGPVRLRSLAAFGAGLVPGAATLAAVNHALYGWPFRFGYGDVGAYFDVAHVVPNLVLYSRWLVQTQGPFVFLALALPFAWRRGGADGSHRPRPPLAPFVVFGSTIVAVYALYLTFENWTYVRFLLPGMPVALALAVTTARAGARRLGALRVPLLVALLAASFAWGLRGIRVLGPLELGIAEARYVTVARYVARALPEPSAFICVLHSGSLRYYAQRQTLRFDWLDPGRLEWLVDRLERRGYHPYLLLEESEEPLFRERFAAHTPLGTLDWPPLARLEAPAVVSVYDPRDRERHLRGEAVVTRTID